MPKKLEMSPYGLAKSADYEPPWMDMVRKRAQAATAEVDQKAAFKEAYDAAYKEGGAAERKRIAGILDCFEAKGRWKQAVALAVDTNMSVENARAFLAATPITPPARSHPSIEERSAEGEGFGPSFTPMEGFASTSDVWSRVTGKLREQ